jgi:hypothetical protein
MTTQEFSSEFDILYNNIMSNAAPGLDEYEKSVFLTKAQEEILKNYFNPKGNKYQEGFDDNEKRQIDFSSLVTVITIPSYSDSQYIKIDDRSLLFLMPNDMLFALNEVCEITENNINRLVNVVPISFIEYSRLISKPYKRPLKNQCWRLISSSSEKDRVFELILPFGSIVPGSYRIRYISRPAPIILVDLSTEYPGLSINGITSVTECELDPSIHYEILQRAVELAKSTYTGDLRTMVELGQRSE